MAESITEFAAFPVVRKLMAQCTFPSDGQSLDCAVSGGADSSALLILAAASGCIVTAHHVDHGLRQGSADESNVVADLAIRLGASFCSHTATIEPGANLEARARSARYALLPNPVATGHTLDDRAETILINLMRGAARTGQSPLTDPTRHPIVNLRRADTEAVCRALGVTPVADPSNNDPNFVRNRVRHELVPLLDDISNRDVALLLDRQADILGDEDRFLDGLAEHIDATDAKAVAAAPTVLARRALRRFIMDNWSLGHPPSVESIGRVLSVAQGVATACEIEGGHRVHRTNQKLRLECAVVSVTPE